MVGRADGSLNWAGLTVLNFDKCEVSGDFRVNIYSRTARDETEKSNKSKKKVLRTVVTPFLAHVPMRPYIAVVYTLRPCHNVCTHIQKTRKKAGKEPGLLFYIYYHTSFLGPKGELQLRKHELGDTKVGACI